MEATVGIYKDERAAQIQGLTNQIAYHGGIAGTGAKLLATYILDLKDRCDALEARVAALEAAPKPRSV